MLLTDVSPRYAGLLRHCSITYIYMTTLDKHQELDLICALIEDAEFCKDLIEEYLDGLSPEDLQACYERNFN